MPTPFLPFLLFKRHTSRPGTQKPRYSEGYRDGSLAARQPRASLRWRNRQYLSFAGRMRRDPEVNVSRNRVVAALIAAFALAATGCGSHANEGHHAAEKATPAPAPPTPDTTPIEALRTPAGMVLRLDAPTAAPVATPTPAK
jgi:hypothetical protein